MKSNIIVSIILLIIFVVVFMQGTELALKYNGKKGIWRIVISIIVFIYILYSSNVIIS
jgi:hypothetical protein